MRYRFGEFELDAGNFHLQRNGVELHVEPRVLEVLGYIVRHRARVIPKSELVGEPVKLLTNRVRVGLLNWLRFWWRFRHHDPESPEIGSPEKRLAPLSAPVVLSFLPTLRSTRARSRRGR